MVHGIRPEAFVVDVMRMKFLNELGFDFDLGFVDGMVEEDEIGVSGSAEFRKETFRSAGESEEIGTEITEGSTQIVDTVHEKFSPPLMTFLILLLLTTYSPIENIHHKNLLCIFHRISQRRIIVQTQLIPYPHDRPFSPSPH